MNNYYIRRAIEKYTKVNGMQDTRVIIEMFSKRFHVTKQKISGNLSAMKCFEKSITIISNKPHSQMF